MKQQALAIRYAQALFDAAAEHGCTDTVEEQLSALLHAMDAEAALRSFWLDRSISSMNKKEWMTTALSAAVHPYVINFLSLLADKQREGLLWGIAAEFASLCRDARGILSVTLTTAAPAEEEQLQALKTVLSRRYDRTVELHCKEDPSLLGGGLLQIGDTCIDGSLRHRLDQLRQQLTR